MKILGMLGLVSFMCLAAHAQQSASLEASTLLATKGRVEINRAGAQVWDPAATNITLNLGDRLRTLENSRATLRLRDATIVNVNELTSIRVAGEQGRSVVDLVRGALSFFHRDKPGDTEVRGGTASAIIRGTEFVASVDADNKFTIVLLEGSVEVTNATGHLVASSGDTVTASANKEPRKSPSFAGANRDAIQWTLYYPAILDPSEILLPAKWDQVVAVYRGGDLVAAADAASRITPETDAEHVFVAALRLGVGDVNGMRAATTNITETRARKLATTLADVVSAVNFEETNPLRVTGANSPTEELAASYSMQSEGEFDLALAHARRAVAISKDFGPSHARLAELEFGSGRLSRAKSELDEALRLSPKLASAVALQGFILAAEGKYAQARESFDAAIQLDAALADAWLGRGLVRFHSGDRVGGRVDMEAATALEPQRAVLRSYLGKAFADEGDDARALHELELAQRLDQKDPTALLYSALLRYRNYDLGGAIRDLEQSADRNGNRAVFRSQMLLDQDAAVRSANLANIYELADMSDLARRESAGAVTRDYSSYSAHLNLASSFNAERDPTRFSLRNETVWFNEHLLATLLAPTDAAPLSQNLSANEYSRLFAKNHVGFSSSTEYFSNREVRQTASQFGNFDRFSYALDLDYGWLNLERPNQELSRIEWYSRAKFQITPADSLLALIKYEDFDSGDNFQYANQALARPNFHFRETQTPLALAGFHHEWTPGSHTLFLGGRLENAQRFNDQGAPQLVGFVFPAGDPASAPFNVAYRNEFVIYSAELNQILETEAHTTIFGGRYQTGDFNATSTLDDAPLGGGAGLFGGATQSNGDGDFRRASVYAYHTWEIIPALRLTGGVSYDDITSPVNYRRPPLESGEINRHAWSPKGALVYDVTKQITIRGAYAETLGGVSYDESVTLEPTQLAGFPQSFRTLISESLVGSVEVPRQDVGGLALDLKLPSRTYISAEGIVLDSAVKRRTGIFDFDANLGTPGVPAGTDENLSYHEHGARLTVSQIVTDEWFVNGAYQFTRAELDRSFPALPVVTPSMRDQSEQSDLHRAALSITYQRKDGWFGRTVVTCLHQENSNPSVPSSETLAQWNLFAGWRFPHLHGDVTFGVLNVTGSNYQLHPLTPYEEYPRERVFYARVRINL